MKDFNSKYTKFSSLFQKNDWNCSRWKQKDLRITSLVFFFNSILGNPDFFGKPNEKRSSYFYIRVDSHAPGGAVFNKIKLKNLIIRLIQSNKATREITVMATNCYHWFFPSLLVNKAEYITALWRVCNYNCTSPHGIGLQDPCFNIYF